MLVEAAPGTFFYTAHYKDDPMVLVGPEKLDLEWARANLVGSGVPRPRSAC